MAINILMPALSPTMSEGKLAKWLKKTGDKVKAGDVIAEIETDKATMEFEAVDEGVLGEILVPAGAEGVKVNQPIATLLDEGEKPGAAPKAAAKPAAPAPVAAPAAAPAAKPAPVAPAVAGARIIASPLARRIAAQQGIDLSRITGSGPRGRIVKADLGQTPSAAPVAKPAAAVVSAPTAAPAAFAAPSPSMNAKALADALGQPYEAHPNSMVRKTIAKRLLESKLTQPHFYLTVDCEIDRLLAAREAVNATAGLKVSVNDFVVKAVACALRDVPAAAAAWTEEATLRYTRFDISVAVATASGLITPIVTDVAAKGLKQIAAEIKDLAARARDGKLKPAEFQGGCFTISNLGMYGIKEFAAVINPPQACILAVGAGEQRAVVKNGQLAVATVMTVTLSVDHRAVDGSVGAEFLKAFKGYIQTPELMLL